MQKVQLFPCRLRRLLPVAVMVLLLFPSPCMPRDAVTEIRIADSRGDWGHPNAFHHYPRGPGYIRMSWIFDTLIWKDRDGFVPALARSWSYDPERLAFIFHLDPRARWHDGRPLTAHDVAFTLEFFKKHPYHWVTLRHVGPSEVIDDQEIVIYLDQSYAPFLSDIGGTMPIMPRHIWESVESPSSWTEPAAFIGSGPYRLVDFNTTRGSYLYEAFEDYYQGRPLADRLVYLRSTQPLLSLTRGEVDLAMIRPDMAEPLRKKGFVIIDDERGWNKKLMINHRKEPFSDRRFRQALAFAIDAGEIIEKSHRGFGSPASPGLLSPDHAMFNPGLPSYSVNPEKARFLIESLGYSRDESGFYHKNGRPLAVELLASSITVGGQNVPDRDGEVLKKQLETVGIKTTLINLEQTTTDSKVRNWDFDLALSGHGGIAGDPGILNELISPAYGAGSVNSARFEGNDELNRILDEQLLEMDEEKRKQLVFRIQELHAEELPALPLYYPSSFAAFNPASGIEWYYTRGGISTGIPIPQNKMSLIP